MLDSNPLENEFLNKINAIIKENISDERFGVSELAHEISMSRSNLLRKIKKSTGLSVSQFIREVRLKNAMEILKQNSQTVSEVSYDVGFSSTSYFIKCFHDYYGYPPGEVEKRGLSKNDSIQNGKSSIKSVDSRNKFIKLWQELKRRKVVKVIIVYASISFILLQLVSILIEPLYLPQWMMSLVIVLLAIGFPIAIIFSWIFDVTPTGIEVTKPIDENEVPQQEGLNQKKGILNTFLIGLLLVIVGILIYPKIIGSGNQEILNPKHDKSIAVLPFKNDSNDDANVHIVNGLMESVLNNLQKIEDLRVISRTSVEKFRNNTKSISEIAKELKVSYFVEGSGQKIGNKILLNIQLIDASNDKHLWSKQYEREASDIFKLQQEVAKNIADKIEVIITPEEEERIDKIPTNDLTAYDYFLRGLDLFYEGNSESLEEAITYFKKAIEHDNQFARAYADIAIAQYLLDAPRAEKIYSEQINDYADNALLFDSKLPQSLIAKAVYYISIEENEMAVPYLEKALEYNPNSTLVINFLSDFYTTHIPDTEKYLEYALKGIQLDIASNDSISASFIYLHVSNAFIQSGFIAEAEMYINKSLDYSPENLFSEYVKAYILYAKNKDLTRTKELLIKAYNKDLTRLDILQEIGKICYYMRDYESSYAYYSKFIEIKEAQQLDIYRYENAKIGLVLDKMEQLEKSEKYFEDYKDYAENDRSIYKDLSLAVYYSYQGDTKKAIEHMKIFSQQDNYHFWTIIFLKMDPLVDNIKELPEFQALLKTIESKFWIKHKEIMASLEEKGLI